MGKSTVLVVTGLGVEKWTEPLLDRIRTCLRDENIDILALIRGARANAPREDVYRIANQIGKKRPDSIIAVAGPCSNFFGKLLRESFTRSSLVLVPQGYVFLK